MKTLRVNFEDLPKGRTPFLTYARKLMKQGFTPDTRVEFFRNNQSEPDVIIPSIGIASLITVLEDRHQGPRFVLYREKVYPYAEKTQTPHVGVES